MGKNKHMKKKTKSLRNDVASSEEESSGTDLQVEVKQKECKAFKF